MVFEFISKGKKHGGVVYLCKPYKDAGVIITGSVCISIAIHF